jgi:predicted transcriptional regulator
VTRTEDERLLLLLERRMAGMTASGIARMTGLSMQAVSQRITAVIREDVLHEPEAARYWAAIAPKGKP